MRKEHIFFRINAILQYNQYCTAKKRTELNTYQGVNNCKSLVHVETFSSYKKYRRLLYEKI